MPFIVTIRAFISIATGYSVGYICNSKSNKIKGRWQHVELLSFTSGTIDDFVRLSMKSLIQ